MATKKATQTATKKRRGLQDFTFILLGALAQALAMRLFLIPGMLVSGGISGAAQIIQHFTGLPIGVMVLVGNIPLYVLGWRYLGGMRFALRTAVAILAFSILTDGLAFFLPLEGITSDLVLNTLYGGVLLGIGLGLVYLGRGTSGGSDVLGRFLNHYRGISISQAYLITDAVVVLAGGFAFGWEHALYGIIVIYISGLAAELISEGSRVVRVALIVTNEAQAVAERIFELLERGATILPGTGGYTGNVRPMLYCVLTRSEVNLLKDIVSEVDPSAFMVIGQANEALGYGFHPLRH
ncbi:MAG TPA: YitT family protein [Anaerolineae bacterium]|nr:YitT family protein [Anaerolineae bacterium]